ncbi:ATP-binding protein [Dactylosporangium sucinum]|uniref:histidine kinase n=1 Tax=Dactylosporangium sucinum TaxID=1424081 RepID=A0A917U5F6_9ACTN|nr:HAMP domain-containing sensor histidine kinase [Dactylosporangium sucinum]GGM59766.1 two-component sensor histidine kinase [Dactylosporangium sucinum]
MRVRLVGTYLVLLLLVLAALEVPFATIIAGRDTQRLVADRLADATRFATLAEPALRASETAEMSAELVRYDELYGITAIVVDQDAHRVVSSRPGAFLDDADVLRQARRALEGREASDDGTVWPWRTDPYVVAVPVGRGGEVIGAVITISPTRERANAVGTAWSILAGGGLVVLFAGIVAAWLLARWTLRPVAELDAAAHELGAGDYAARVPAADGPPELRRLGTAFNEMAATVADSLERQRAFVSNASHQLRNPLTALRLRVEDLGADLTDPDAVEGHKLALEEAERLGEVLDSLLALARAERGRFELADFDAGEVAWARIVAWQPVATKKQITLRYVRPPHPLRARAVTTALDQTLDALIDNAVKFSGPGATVTVRPTADEGGVAVHVVDTGPGLSEQQRELATVRFWRAPDAQNVDGSGLGLPIVAVLVEASGGRLDLQPNTPTGLQARVWFPAAPA